MDRKTALLEQMKICRFCFSDRQNELSEIYQKKRKENKHPVPLPLQIMACLGIEVFPNDGMPQYICLNCKQQTQQCYIFKANCKRAHEALKQFLYTRSEEIKKPVFELSKYPTRLMPKQFAITTKGSKTSVERVVSASDGTEVITLNIEKDSQDEQGKILDQSQNIVDVDEPMDVSHPVEYQITQDEDGEPELLLSTPKTHKEVSRELSDPEIYPCRLCIRTFPSEHLLKTHFGITHKSQKPYACDLCTRKFQSKAELDIHEPIHFPSSATHQCKLCEKTFMKEHMLRRHQLVHNHDYCPRCVQCGKECQSKTELEDHIYAEHPASHAGESVNESFWCKLCNKSFVFQQGLERHLLTHVDSQKTYSCMYCSESFDTAVEHAKHNTEHTSLRPYICKVCNRNFTVNHHLTRHMKCHAAIEHGTPLNEVVEKYKCDLCSMGFMEQYELLEHSIVHSIVNLTCAICNTRFETTGEVQNHIKTHLKDLPCKCSKCFYSFEQPDQLEMHLLKHAQMEYEEKIEQELIKEARKTGSQAPIIPVQKKAKKDAKRTPKQQTLKKPTISISRLKKSIEKKLEEPKPKVLEVQDEEGEIIYTLDLAGGDIVHELPHPDGGWQIVPEVQSTKSNQEPYSEPQENPHDKEILPVPEQKAPVEEYETDDVEEIIEFDPLGTDQPPERQDVPMEESMEPMEEATFEPYHQEAEAVGIDPAEYNSQQLFKCEVDSDDGGPETVEIEDDAEKEPQEQAVQSLKPIVRNEGTKMYARRGIIERKLPQIDRTPPEQPNFAPPEEINDSSTSIPLLDLTEENIPIAKPLQTNLEKIGDKVVKVQKFIMTKQEIRKMQKQGLIEVRGGKVVLKSNNSSILDASIKPVQKVDIDNFIKSTPKQQLRSYQRRITESEASILEHVDTFRSQL